jgi:hypothetical protein
MIPEAEVFLLADKAMVAAVGQIRDEHWDTVVPPSFEMPGADQPAVLRDSVNHLAYDEAWIPDMLAGRTMDEAGRDKFDGDLLGTDPIGTITRIAAAASAAAAGVTDPAAIVHCSYGECPVDDYFWQLNIARSIAAHDLAVHIGAPCPLTEELSRGMYEGTSKSADMWRSFGIYRAEVPVGSDASWRDRFLALTGRQS